MNTLKHIDTSIYNSLIYFSFNTRVTANSVQLYMSFLIGKANILLEAIFFNCIISYRITKLEEKQFFGLNLYFRFNLNKSARLCINGYSS